MSGVFDTTSPFSSVVIRKRKACRFLQVIILLLLISSCRKSTWYPKPVAYPRIDYPSSSYNRYNDQNIPVSFEYPSFCALSENGNTSGTKGITLSFRSFNAGLYLSISRIKKQRLNTYLSQFEQAVSNQTPPECTVMKIEYEKDSKNNEGFLYLTQGFSPVPIQFFVHNPDDGLMTGSLVFNQVVNPDSIPEVLTGMKRDVKHLIETLEL